ncbi:MAG: IS3 family transposase [Anaerolineae bacterium]|nr:IS3 family transposase [Anaerolineae bacterium]
MSGQDQRRAVAELQAKGLSERAACETSGVTRRVARYRAKQPERDAALEVQIRTALNAHPEFGYRQAAGFIQVSEDRVRRLWKRLGLTCAKPKKSRRKIGPSLEPRPHRAEFRDHVWSYDFMHDRLFDRSAYRLLNVLDEYTRECLTIHVNRSIKSEDVIQVLWEVMKTTGRKPKFLRSDNGAEFTAPAVTQWLAAQQVGPTFIDLGSPWQNGFLESFNGKLRTELLKREWFYSIEEAAIVIEQWRLYYNNERPHSALNRLPPSQFAAALHAV